MQRAYQLNTEYGINQAYRALGINLQDLSVERPWIPDGDAALIHYYQRGITVDKMAKDFNRSTDDVARRIIYLGEQGKITPGMWGKRASGLVARGPLDTEVKTHARA